MSTQPVPTLRLLSREDCHLCEVAQRDLDILGTSYDVVDIDRDDDRTLVERYNDVIPVLLYGETEVARAPIDRNGLKKALARLKLTGTRR
jgi:thioredoxin reductase (NADPH)